MTSKFRIPNFAKRDLELRFENDVVCIYGTPTGLKKLCEMIEELVAHPNRGHIHLEKDYEKLLTDESESGAVAIFEKES